MNNENSLSNLEHKWYPEVRKACPNTPFIVVGTKSDFRLDHDESDKSDKQDHSEITLVDKAKGEEIAKKIGAKKYIETSAKKMKNVRKVFEEAVKAVLYKHVQTKMEDKHEAKKSGCCRVM